MSFFSQLFTREPKFNDNYYYYPQEMINDMKINKKTKSRTLEFLNKFTQSDFGIGGTETEYTNTVKPILAKIVDLGKKNNRDINDLSVKRVNFVSGNTEGLFDWSILRQTRDVFVPKYSVGDFLSDSTWRTIWFVGNQIQFGTEEKVDRLVCDVILNHGCILGVTRSDKNYKVIVLYPFAHEVVMSKLLSDETKQKSYTNSTASYYGSAFY